MTYCRLFEKYVNKPTCDQCDTRSGYRPDTWTYTCSPRMRVDRHPIVRQVKWWLTPGSYYFKLLHVVRWISNRFNPERKFTIWSSSGQGWKVGYPNWSGWIRETTLG